MNHHALRSRPADVNNRDGSRLSSEKCESVRLGATSRRYGTVRICDNFSLQQSA
jgi:hypothetical protein